MHIATIVIFLIQICVKNLVSTTVSMKYALFIVKTVNQFNIDFKPQQKSCYGPVRLQRLSQRMPTYEKLMQNVGIR